jgi:hypothetical protein
MPIRDEDGHRAMQAAGKAWNAIKTSGPKTWREWTQVIGPGLVKARAEAQRISNASSGKGYNAAMGALLGGVRIRQRPGTAAVSGHAGRPPALHGLPHRDRKMAS